MNYIDINSPVIDEAKKKHVDNLLQNSYDKYVSILCNILKDDTEFHDFITSTYNIFQKKCQELKLFQYHFLGKIEEPSLGNQNKIKFFILNLLQYLDNHSNTSAQVLYSIRQDSQVYHNDYIETSIPKIKEIIDGYIQSVAVAPKDEDNQDIEIESSQFETLEKKFLKTNKLKACLDAKRDNDTNEYEKLLKFLSLKDAPDYFKLFYVDFFKKVFDILKSGNYNSDNLISNFKNIINTQSLSNNDMINAAIREYFNSSNKELKSEMAEYLFCDLFNKTSLKQSIDKIPLLKRDIKFILETTPENLNEIKDIFALSNTDSISKIFNYKVFIVKSKTDSYDGYTLAKNLDIPTCVYCNRMYTKTVIVEKDKIIRPEFDHWFPKSIYPLLQLSFFNLIPSCHVCNSNVKGKEDFKLDTHFHPYHENEIVKKKKEHRTSNYKDLDYQFSFEFQSGYLNRVLKIKKNNDFTASSIDSFKLEQIYSMHEDEMNDLISLRSAYTNSHIFSIKIIMKDIMSDAEIYRLVFGTYLDEKEHYKRPLSRMKRDILEELEIILNPTSNNMLDLSSCNNTNNMNDSESESKDEGNQDAGNDANEPKVTKSNKEEVTDSIEPKVIEPNQDKGNDTNKPEVTEAKSKTASAKNKSSVKKNGNQSPNPNDKPKGEEEN